MSTVSKPVTVLIKPENIETGIDTGIRITVLVVSVRLNSRVRTKTLALSYGKVVLAGRRVFCTESLSKRVFPSCVV